MSVSRRGMSAFFLPHIEVFKLNNGGITFCLCTKVNGTAAVFVPSRHQIADHEPLALIEAVPDDLEADLLIDMDGG